MHEKKGACRLPRLLSMLTLVLLVLPVAAEDRLAEYYSRSVPAAEKYISRFSSEAPAVMPEGNFTAGSNILDNIALIASARADLPEGKRPDLHQTVKLFRIAEAMQDKNPKSPSFGNFRWYWNNQTVTDLNAVVFVTERMLPVYYESFDLLPAESQTVLKRMMERSVTACLARKVPPDYTNIAVMNAVHLILLGQIFDRTELCTEGRQRLWNITACLLDHGIAEYNSPHYYPNIIDTLQLGFRYINNAEMKQMIEVLLDYFWTDLSLHWFRPGLRLAGSQSRSYDYLTGAPMNAARIMADGGLAPYNDKMRHYAVLRSFRALYHPPETVTALNGQYPRYVFRRWGKEPQQWASMMMFHDIALGIAGAQYGSPYPHCLPLTVDISDDSDSGDLTTHQYQARCYFIADGRGDPFAEKRSPVGRAEHPKALNLDALWFGSQRTVDAVGVVLYPQKNIHDPAVTNVMSHFVFRKPESGRCEVRLHEAAVIACYPHSIAGIRVLWMRDIEGQTPAAADSKRMLSLNTEDLFHHQTESNGDSNHHDSRRGVFLLTVNHNPWHPAVRKERMEKTAMAGAAFWIRIGSGIDTGDAAKTEDWISKFIGAKVVRSQISGNSFDFAVEGRDGIVSVRHTDTETVIEPELPAGILMLNGKDLGRPVLEKIPAVKTFSEAFRCAKPVVIVPSGTYWEAASGIMLFDPLTAGSGQPSAAGVRVNADISYLVQIDAAGEYFLWGRVLTQDGSHDSFRFAADKRLPDGSFDCRRAVTDWALGTRRQWTWVKLPVPLRLEKGVWRFTLSPREPDGIIDRLYLTTAKGNPL
ncbi:MAG: hypothetical protein LBH00_04805 [Planctomycetaceae bacterium]|jgi:hypothetical protein|nr:hypothetical protein [Planctomycetaceae bacterium]